MSGLGGVHPEVVRRWNAFESFVRSHGYEITVTSGFRSIEKQRQLFEARRRGEHPFPVARPGCSEHNHGLAVDAVTSLPDRFIAPVAKYFGLVWAGKGDAVHYGVFTQAQWGRVAQQEKLC